VTPAGGERDDSDSSEPFGALPEDLRDDGGQDEEADAALDLETPDDAAGSALPPKVEAWRKRTATGAVLTGFALGLQQVFEKEKEEPAIVMQTSGDPPMDLPVEADMEHGRPRQSIVNIRPWLLADRRGEPGEVGEAAQPEEPGVAGVIGETDEVNRAYEAGPAAPTGAAGEARPDEPAPGDNRPDTGPEDT
jgi:hypothetical protein